MRFPWTRTEGWAQCRYPKKGKGYWHWYRPHVGGRFHRALWLEPLCGGNWTGPRPTLHRKPKGERCPVCARRKR